jgi:PTS system nitrogen regulatory IIA component
MTSTIPLPLNVLSKTLAADLILVDAELSSAKKLLEEMARLLTTALSEETREKDILHQLIEREKLGNTGIGNGVALPHSRCEQASSAVVAIISLKTPIDYDSIDKQGVDLAFGLLVPKEASQEHLNLLADIARLMSDPAKKMKLSAARSPQEMIDLISAWSIEN